ncbi:MAG TPA: PQQ-dependent sugar dehydrogenase [Candidatus Saccharimonadales bacterium]|nr:PQQ-dependent sugar dehydrogenase [Candidatus Saccharimonadales bacterium]
MLESYALTANESQIYSVTTNDSLYQHSQLDSGLEMYDKYREYVEINNTDKYNTNTFSISFWLKGIRDTSPYGHVVSYTNRENTAGWFFELRTSEVDNNSSSANQSLRFGLTNSSDGIIFTENVYVSNSSFVNIIATFNGSNIKLYNDGNLFQEIKFNGNYTSDPKLPLHIGSASYCSSCNRWSGIIDDLRIYDKALTEQEVKTLSYPNMDNDNTALDGLVGYWKLNGNLNDISKYHNNGKMFTPLSSMVFTSDGKMFFSEKNTGIIRIMENNQVLKKPFVIITDHYVDWEQGILGLAVDREYQKNHYIYLYYTTIKNDEPVNRVVRFTDVNNTARDLYVLIDNIPASRGFHAGGALAIGPDDKLYITVGDATQHELAQSVFIEAGKVLRINTDGSIPSDNPFPNSPVYTLGHRNMFGIAFDDKNKIGIVTENGDVLYDEVNLLKKGGNYGFPTLQPANISPELSNSTLDIKPLRSYWNTNAPTQAIYYTGDNFPVLKNRFLFGTYTGNIYGIYINNETQHVTNEIHIKLRHYPFEPVIGIAQSPGGDIYSGSYHINKLTSIELNNSRQDLFPIGLISPSNVVIDKITMSTNKEIQIHLHRNSTGTNLKNDQTLTIQVPKSLLNELINITTVSNLSETGLDQRTVNYTISNDDNQYFNNINIHLPKDNMLYFLINSTESKNHHLIGRNFTE